LGSQTIWNVEVPAMRWPAYARPELRKLKALAARGAVAVLDDAKRLNGDMGRGVANRE
jgi:hypothetical protein